MKFLVTWLRDDNSVVATSNVDDATDLLDAIDALPVDYVGLLDRGATSMTIMPYVDNDRPVINHEAADIVEQDNIVPLDRRRPPVWYDVAVCHHWDRTVETWVKGVNMDDPENRVKVGRALQQCAASLLGDEGTMEPWIA